MWLGNVDGPSGINAAHETSRLLQSSLTAGDASSNPMVLDMVVKSLLAWSSMYRVSAGDVVAACMRGLSVRASVSARNIVAGTLMVLGSPVLYARMLEWSPTVKFEPRHCIAVFKAATNSISATPGEDQTSMHMHIDVHVRAMSTMVNLLLMSWSSQAQGQDDLVPVYILTGDAL